MAVENTRLCFVIFSLARLFAEKEFIFGNTPKILVRSCDLHAMSEILTTCAEFSSSEAFYSVALTSASMSISKEASFTSTEIRANQVLTNSIDVTYGNWGIALINIYQENAKKLYEKFAMKISVVYDLHQPSFFK